MDFPNSNLNHHIVVGSWYFKLFYQVFFYFEGVILAIRGRSCVLRAGPPLTC